MPQEIRSNRWSQIVAWIIAGLFVLGFFLDSIGSWTGPILGVWFVGTQRPRRGFLWMLLFGFISELSAGWRAILFTSPQHALLTLSGAVLVAVLSVLPFTFHRLAGARLPGFAATLPFPLAAVVFHVLVAPLLPFGIASIMGINGMNVDRFLILWFAAVIVWMWNHEFRATTAVAGAAVLVAAGPWILRRFDAAPIPQAAPIGPAFAWVCLAGSVLLSLYAFARRNSLRTCSLTPETVSRLRSPWSGSPLQAATEAGRTWLLSTAGERFPVREGVPNFIRPNDLTGDNGKYNHLYETIGGFYNDTQRVFGAFRGLDLDSYFLNYMSLLDVKPGDAVLETSVGTGLNFRYLPRGVRLAGLDLSPEMLANCQANLRRWGMRAELCLGNAESLPFADSTFDVVYTAGALNFFNDRAKAIHEMIRVAKPGGRLMIEDETEAYAKSTYERMPVAGSYFKDRKEEIRVPVDLVPAEMEDMRVEMLKEGTFYAITFRKPQFQAGPAAASLEGGAAPKMKA